MGRTRNFSLQSSIDSLKNESKHRSMQSVLTQISLEPFEHNTFWLDGVTESTEIYRFLSFKRLLNIYATNQVSIKQTIKWDDPFENFLFKSDVRDQSGNLVSLGELAKNWYGQCWTLEKETDALWRIYSSQKDGVRISTTIGKLFRSFYNNRDQFAALNHYMTGVKYLKRSIIEDFMRRTSFSDLTSGGQTIQFAALLSVKRTEFAHEKEVRLLRHTQNPPGEWMKLHFDPNAVIEEITFDPRLENSKLSRRKAKLKAVGCTASFEESTLYKLDRIVIKL